MDRGFHTNANDVAHAATFPPAGTRRGGRKYSVSSSRPSVRPSVVSRAFGSIAFDAGSRRLSTTPLYTLGAYFKIRESPRRMRFPVWERSDALKCTRVFEYDVNDAPLAAGRRSDGLGSKGLCTPDGLQIRPKEMRILPLRSAVQMGSDVSLGSSVTPDRSSRSTVCHRTWTISNKCECVPTFTANLPSSAGEEHSG